MQGTRNLKELVDLILVGAEVTVAARQDGKVDLNDLGLLLKVIQKIGPALEGAGEIPSELSDLTVEEANDLVSHIMASLAIGDEKARKVLAAALKLGVAAIELAKVSKE